MTNQTANADIKEKIAPQQNQFDVAKVFIKGMSFEVFQNPTMPADKPIKFSLSVDKKAKQLDQTNKVYEVNLTLTLTASLDERNLFFTKLTQAGLFVLKNFSEEQLAYMLAAYCPNILFPYARRAIADMVLHAGFPQVDLSPINFDAIYQQQLQPSVPESALN